jgi:flagellar FliL protein
MAAKENKPKKPSAPTFDPPPEGGSKDSSPDNSSKGAAKGGLVKIVAIALVAMIVGVGIAIGAMKFMGSSKEASGPSAELSPAAEAEAPSSGPAAAPEAEEPITAPSKGAPAEAAGGGAHGGAAAAAGAEAAAALGPRTVKLDPFTTNLNEPSGRRYLKLTLSMEVDNQDAANELTSVMDIVKNDILMLLSSQSVDDISSMDGKLRLQNQILNRANNAMKNHKVRRVFYSEFVIQ